MPTVTTKKYLVFIATNSNTYRDSHSRTFKITNANPVFNDFVYEDISSATLLLSGNNQRIIQGYSNIQAIFSAATGQKGATIKKYTLINGSQTVSRTNVGTLLINKATSQLLELIAEDSRGNKTTITKTIPFVPYSKPIIQNLVLDREPGTETTTYITTKGIYQNVNFGAVVNKIKKIEYRSKSTGAYGSWNDITPLIASGGGTYQNIAGAFLNFTFGAEFEVELRVHDELSNQVMTAEVSKGLYLAWVDHEYKSIGFGVEPKKEENSIAVKGNIYAPNVLNYEIIGDI